MHHNYGFIVRFQAGKEASTGYMPEAWHIRYVGKPHAELIYRSRMTLEEYLESLDTGAFYSYGGYGFSLQEPDENGTLSIPSSWQEITVSPDNTGRYMVTGRILNS